jgi:mycothiol synthase
MTLNHKPYTGQADLRRMQAMLAESIRKIGGLGYLHVGDIPHRIYNGLRHFSDREQLVHLWETDTGQLVGWTLLYPHWDAFDTQIHADYKGTDAERAILEWTVDEISRRARIKHAQADQANRASEDHDDPPMISTDVHVGDTLRIDLLTELGFADRKPFINLTTRPLDVIPDPVLPDGFTIRHSAGMPDAARLVAVHSGAFNSKWTVDLYEMVLNSPGFVAENEWIVVAPNGEFAAFTIIWFDAVNKIGLFEPVGTHEAYQRRGLGRALITHAMHVMRANGMTKALVGHYANEEKAAQFYHSLGFRTAYEIREYAKPI